MRKAKGYEVLYGIPANYCTGGVAVAVVALNGNSVDDLRKLLAAAGAGAGEVSGASGFAGRDGEQVQAGDAGAGAR